MTTTTQSSVDGAPQWIPAYEPLPSVLIVSQLVRKPQPTGKKEDETKLFYTVEVEAPFRSDNITFGFCNLAVKEELEERSVVEFSATYVFAVKSDQDIFRGEQYKIIAEQQVKAAVWPRFRDLVAYTASQAQLDLPMLPSEPGEIRVNLEQKGPPPAST